MHRLALFPSLAGMSLTKLSLVGKKIKLFPAKESLVSDILAVDGKMANLFLQCVIGQTSNRRSFATVIL